MKNSLIVLALCFVPACTDSADVPGADDPVAPVEPAGPEVLEPVDPPKPVVCAAGETLGLGSSIDYPELAGTKDGYAVLFREDWSNREPAFMVFDRAGDAAGPTTLFPGTDYLPGLTSDDDGYVIKSVLPSSVQSSFFWAGPDGAISASAIGAQWAGTSVDLVDGTLRGLTLAYTEECGFNPFPFRFAVGNIDGEGAIGDLVLGPCMSEAGWWTHGFAARSDSAVFLTQVQDYRTDEAYAYDMTVTVFVDGGYRQYVLGRTDYVAGTHWMTSGVRNVAATEDGYAILWTRETFDLGADRTHRSFLTFIGTDGDLLGTIETAPFASDLVWNGREFGLVRDEIQDGVRSVVIDRLTARGETIASLRFPAAGDANGNLRIASSDGGYAVAYGVLEAGTMEVYLTPVACE